MAASPNTCLLDSLNGGTQIPATLLLSLASLVALGHACQSYLLYGPRGSGGVDTLLGHRVGSHYSGEMSPIVLGILYLRMHRDVRDVMFMT